MVRVLGLIVAVFLTTGCSNVTKVKLRYLGNSNDISRAGQTPAGFAVSPQEAVDIINSFHGPKKTVDDFYCDGEHYYVIDGYSGSKATRALESGVKIDGQTGRLFDPAKKEWVDVPRSEAKERKPQGVAEKKSPSAALSR